MNFEGARYLGGTDTAHAHPDPQNSFAGFLLSVAIAALGSGALPWVGGAACTGFLWALQRSAPSLRVRPH
ncbi:MAG: hypothetical protein RSC68_35525, partial [Acinetobacter sp.]